MAARDISFRAVNLSLSESILKKTLIEILRVCATRTGLPLGPSSPGGPLAPAGPAAPGGPASPFSPLSPLGPCSDGGQGRAFITSIPQEGAFLSSKADTEQDGVIKTDKQSEAAERNWI